MSESEFLQHPPEHEQRQNVAGLFDTLESSVDEVVEIEHCRRLLTESLEGIVSKLNVPKISALSRELIGIGAELRQIEIILRSCPNRSRSYRRTSAERLKAGKRVLDALRKQFEAADVFGFLEYVSANRLMKRAKLTLSELPDADRLILARLRLSEAEQRILSSIFDQLACGESVNISRLFDPSRFDPYSGFENLPDPPVNEVQRRKRHIVLTAGGYKIFTGVGLIGLDIAGFATTAGVLVTGTAAIASMFTGGAMLVDGAKEIDISRLDHPE